MEREVGALAASVAIGLSICSCKAAHEADSVLAEQARLQANGPSHMSKVPTSLLSHAACSRWQDPAMAGSMQREQSMRAREAVQVTADGEVARR